MKIETPTTRCQLNTEAEEMHYLVCYTALFMYRGVYPMTLHNAKQINK